MLNTGASELPEKKHVDPYRKLLPLLMNADNVYVVLAKSTRYMFHN